MRVELIRAIDMADRCYYWEGGLVMPFMVNILANGMEDMNRESLVDVLYESYFDIEFDDED